MKENYSTYATLFTETPEQAAVFDRWLSERVADGEIRAEVACELRDSEEGFPTQVDEKLSEACDAYNEDIQPGQIRILSKRFTENPDVIPYVAVLEKWGNEMWLVAPFSQYSTPATSGEMTTGVGKFGLRVIQAWNGRTVQARLLGKSFLFGVLEDSVRTQALALFRHEFAGTDLPADFSAQRGSSILMAADPRREYLAEAVSRLRPLSTAVKAVERFAADQEMQKIRESFIKCSFGEQLSRVAAKNQMQMIETHKFGDFELELVYSPSEKTLRFKMYGADDELTESCDGYALLSGSGEFLGSFSGGLLQIPSDGFLDEFRITDVNGDPVLEKN